MMKVLSYLTFFSLILLISCSKKSSFHINPNSNYLILPLEVTSIGAPRITTIFEPRFPRSDGSCLTSKKCKNMFYTFNSSNGLGYEIIWFPRGEYTLKSIGLKNSSLMDIKHNEKFTLRNGDITILNKKYVYKQGKRSGRTIKGSFYGFKKLEENEKKIIISKISSYINFNKKNLIEQISWDKNNSQKLIIPKSKEIVKKETIPKSKIKNVTFSSNEKSQTIIVPTGTLGDISEVRKKMLEKTLESKIDNYFDIVPKDLFEEAQEKAFEELEYEECTEERCIMLIKEMLQVENSFQMVLMAEDGDTQISLTWNDLDKKRVEEEYCEGCKTKELRKMVEGLVEKLVGNKTIQKQVVIKNLEKGILYGSSCLFGKGKGCSGIWEWYESKNEKTDHIYEGEILNGVPHGKGKNTDEHGNYFTGNYKDGIEFGIGTLDMVKNNSKYIGEFKDGQIISGTQHFYNSGNRYEGEFHNGKRNGQGTFYYKKNNTKFVGNWKNGKKFNGIMYNDNEKNIGEWKDGLKQK